jgi:hypothetical protein
VPEPSLKAQAWSLVASAPFADLNPWEHHAGRARYLPDFETLCRLLAVSVLLEAPSQSGVPALALDVWTAYELRRAGFHPDRVWPRASAPRVLPFDVSALVESLPAPLRIQVKERLDRGQSGGTTSASANLLGKNYVKQVDVVMSAWQTGPELLISTKRMDSSFGKNAANRVEESYGDAKNLSLRHPQAALGFLYGLRSTAFESERDVADWLIDLLTKLGREDDAYDAVGLVVPNWGTPLPPGDIGDEEEPAPMAIEPAIVFDDTAAEPAKPELVDRLNELPAVTLRHDLVPPELSPSRFFAVMVKTVLDNSPINFHRKARDRRAEPRSL